MTWKTFYSYSHKDADLRAQLGTYLAPLRQQNKIIEWHDREIQPGANWNSEINAHLDSANLIILLISPDFLASEYCFGVEIEKALSRLKRGDVTLVPVLLRPCLWEESRFSELQIIPRDAKAITSWASMDEALRAVAVEIRAVVSNDAPELLSTPSQKVEENRFEVSLHLVRQQINTYARAYERTRQRLRPSPERTQQMEAIFQQMRALATASYPLLDELAKSPSPGDRLAAISILQAFSSETYLPFLVKLVGSEKPFVGYHATKALRFAVRALDSRAYSSLLAAIQQAQSMLKSASVGFDSDRQSELRAAEDEVVLNISTTAESQQRYD